MKQIPLNAFTKKDTVAWWCFASSSLHHSRSYSMLHMSSSRVSNLFLLIHFCLSLFIAKTWTSKKKICLESLWWWKHAV